LPTLGFAGGSAVHFLKVSFAMMVFPFVFAYVVGYQ